MLRPGRAWITWTFATFAAFSAFPTFTFAIFSIFSFACHGRQSEQKFTLNKQWYNDNHIERYPSILTIIFFRGRVFCRRNPWPIRCARVKSSLPSAMAGAWCHVRTFLQCDDSKTIQNPVLCWSKAKLLQRFLLFPTLQVVFFVGGWLRVPFLVEKMWDK